MKFRLRRDARWAERLEVGVFLFSRGEDRVLERSLASLVRSCGGGRQSVGYCVVDVGSKAPPEQAEAVDRTLGRGAAFFALERSVGRCAAYRAAMELAPGLLASRLVLLAEANLDFLLPLSVFADILDSDAEILAATGEHSPEHVVIGRRRGYFVKNKERGGHLLMRGPALARHLPLRCLGGDDVADWFVGRARDSGAAEGRWVASVPAGVAPLPCRSTRARAIRTPDHPPERLRASLRSLNAARDLQRFRAAAEVLTIEGDLERTDTVLRLAAVGGRNRLDRGSKPSSTRWRRPTEARLREMETASSRAGPETLFPNPTLASVSGELRYFSTIGAAGTGQWFRLDRTGALEAVLDRAQEGAAEGAEGAGRRDLVAALSAWDEDLREEDAGAFVDEMRSLAVLVPNLALPEWRREGKLAESASSGASGAAEWQVVEVVEGGGAEIGCSEIEAIELGAAALLRLCGPTAEQRAMEGFHDRFLHHYGRQEAPMLEAICTVGYRGALPAEAAGDRLGDRLETLLEGVWRRGHRELLLGPAELDLLAEPDPQLPGPRVEVDSIVASAGRDALAAGSCEVWVQAVRDPANGWWQSYRPVLPKRARRAWAAEGAEDECGSDRGLSLRPVVGSGTGDAKPLGDPVRWQIVGPDGAREAISLSALVLAAEEGHMELRLSGDGRPVWPALPPPGRPGEVPRESPVTSFLHQLTRQGRLSLATWSWGAAERWQLLPRVRCGGALLTPARRTLRSEDVASNVGGWLDQVRDQIGRWAEVGGKPVDLWGGEAEALLRETVAEKGWVSITEAPPESRLRLVVPLLRRGSPTEPRGGGQPSARTSSEAARGSPPWRCWRSERIDLVFGGSNCGSPYLPGRPRFVRMLERAAERRGLRFLHCDSPQTADRLRVELTAGQVTVGVLINYLGSDPAFRHAGPPLAEAIGDRGGLLLNDEVRSSRLNKAVLHGELSRAGLRVPRTKIWRSWEPDRELTEEELAGFGAPQVWKPSSGGGGRGVRIANGGTLTDVEDLRAIDRDADWLVQEYVEPAPVAGRPGWFRVYHCLGRSLPYFWRLAPGAVGSDGLLDVSQTVVEEADGLPAAVELELSRIVGTVGTVTGCGWFSCEVAAVDRDGNTVFELVDYFNERPYARARSEVGEKGVPDSVLEAAAERMASEAERRAERSASG